MKYLITLLTLAVTTLAADVDLSKPLPRLRLADGRILQEVSFVNFKTLDVFVRHKAGSLSLRYEALPDEIRAEAEKKRPGGPRWFPGEVAANQLILDGQVFVQTQGAGPYKFGNVKVYAFDAQFLKSWDETYLREIQLPRPISEATTDGDGRFKLSVPKDRPYFVYCATSRLVGAMTERNEWRVPGEKFKDAKSIVLSNDTVGTPTKIVMIEPTP